MKIVYLSKSKIPSRTANSIHVMKICQAFAKNNHTVTLMTPNYPDIEPGIINSYDFYGVEQCFSLSKLPKPKNWIKGLIKYHAVTKFLIKNQKPTVVYARCNGRNLFNLAGLDVPLIFEAHQFHKDNGISKLLKNRHLKRLVVISDALRQEYQKHYQISDNLIKVVHDAADDPDQMAPISLNSSNQLKVGYVGHLYPGKGMEIISQLASLCDWADFHIVGGFEKDISFWKNKLQENKNVYFHGFLPPSQAMQYSQACDVLIAPYKRNVIVGPNTDIGKWMSPLKIFEYMAIGKPILASNLPVIREVLTHQVDAWLCSPENISEWVAGLTALRDDHTTRLSLSSNARKLFKNQYTWQSRAERVISNLSF